MTINPYVRLFVRLIVMVKNWPIYFVNRYTHIRKPEVQYHLRNGITVVSRSFEQDGSALNDVWLDQSYDPNHFGMPFDWANCRTILDIGGNIGTFTLYAAHYAPQARIVTVEPEPGNAKMIRRNVAINHLENRVSLVEAGIAEKPGTATFHLSWKNNGGHSLFKHKESGESVTVQVTTLESIFRDNAITACDFLKLDCEGGEYDGLFGLSAESLKCIKFMAIEYHYFSKDPRHSPALLRTYLEEKGFTVTAPKNSLFFARKN